MLIDVLFTPSMAPSETDLRHKTVIVIDTLRATSTVVAALAAGAREVVPSASIESAVAIAQRLGTDRTLLCGERNAEKINGFHLGNSPLEYTPEVVAGKTLVLVTTNGTAALLRAHLADRVFCGALVNAGRLASAIDGLEPQQLTLLCAGTVGRLSLEDLYAAGAIIAELRQRRHNTTILSDGAHAALTMFEHAAGDLPGALAATSHGQTLLQLGFGPDISYCSRLNIPEAPIPILDGATIRAYDHTER